MNIIEINGLKKDYPLGNTIVPALRGVDLQVAEGDFMSIIGPSGSGKSSLLYMLAGLKDPSEGRVRFRSRDLRTLSPADRADIRRRHFGFIFQQHFLVNYLTVLENVLVGSKQPDAAARQRATDLLERISGWSIHWGAWVETRPLGLEGADRDWVNRRQTPQPFKLYQQPLDFDAERVAAVPRTFINASAGWLVEGLGWFNFFLLCTALAVPGMLLLSRVAPWHAAKEAKAYAH